MGESALVAARSYHRRWQFSSVATAVSSEPIRVLCGVYKSKKTDAVASIPIRPVHGCTGADRREWAKTATLCFSFRLLYWFSPPGYMAAGYQPKAY